MTAKKIALIVWVLLTFYLLIAYGVFKLFQRSYDPDQLQRARDQKEANDLARSSAAQAVPNVEQTDNV